MSAKRYPSESFSFLIGIFALVASHSASAEDKAESWLMKINHAARTLNFQGIFVYQHGTQVETMRLIHKVEHGRVRERLISLNGAPREITRDDKIVRCYLPDENLVLVEHRKSDDKTFPKILPERLQDWVENYEVMLGKSDRIAGRATQAVIIRPRDQYRYGYQLWADIQTGLLLKADLLDNNGKILEQFLFTQVDIGQPISDQALVPPQISNKTIHYREKENGGLTQIDALLWQVTNLPKGFRLTATVSRRHPIADEAMDHLVFTDGLAAVSVFIKKRDRVDPKPITGASRMGAVNAYGRVLQGNYQVTVVGEVPAATVALIGESLMMSP
jgi:sigma-E factor negative regulatory protein RseB